MSTKSGFFVLLACVSVVQTEARCGMISTFEEEQRIEVGGAPPGTQTDFGTISDTGSLGGARGILVTRTSNAGTISVDVNYSMFGALAFNSSAGAAGFAEIHFDGGNASPILDPDGLGAIDLTDSGLNTGFHFRATSDLGATLTLAVSSGTGFTSVASVEVLADPTFAFQDFTIPFSAFSPETGFTAADFTKVGAISLLIDGRAHAGTDVAIGPIQVSAVPEPSTLLMSGIGLIGGSLAVWRRRSRRPQE